MEAEAFGALLARTNATLNLSSGILLMIGWVFIRRGDVRRHRLSMLGAVTTSSLFLIFYVTRFTITGTHSFAGVGIAKTVCLGILFSHMTLAVLIVPCVLSPLIPRLERALSGPPPPGPLGLPRLALRVRYRLRGLRHALPRVRVRLVW
jgi:uncharacterized membrane protein YozB (DUF420 family)